MIIAKHLAYDNRIKSTNKREARNIHEFFHGKEYFRH